MLGSSPIEDGAARRGFIDSVPLRACVTRGKGTPRVRVGEGKALSPVGRKEREGEKESTIEKDRKSVV